MVLHRKQSIIVLASCSILYGTWASEAAGVDNFELSPEQLFDATVMSVSKTSEKLIDAPAAIYVLTSEDIKRSGATSIPEALRGVPGVEVARINANSWAISVRGFNSGLANKLLVLIDGRAVYDPLYSGVYWDVQDTALEDIDRIEIIRGPGATLWGANAVDGVINIITKSSTDTQGTMVSALAGNQDKAITTGRYGGTMGDNGTWRVYGKYLNRDDEQTVRATGNGDEWQESRGGFRTDWKTADKARDAFTVQGDIYNSDTGQKRFESFLSAPFTRLEQENILAHGGNVLGRWTRNFSEDSKLTVQGYVDYTSRDQLLIEDKRTAYDLDAQYEFPYQNGQKIIIGTDYHLNLDDLTQTTPTVTFTSAQRNDQLLSAFLQDKITLVPKTWFLTLGSKLEHNDYTGIEVEPSARLQWHPSDRQMIWASVSRAVRTPSRLERDLTVAQTTSAGPFSLNTVGDPNFESEDLIAYELGYRHQLTPKLSLDVAAFCNDYKKLSTLTLTSLRLPPSSAPFFFNYDYTNQSSGETYGVETSVSWRALPALNLSASHSFLVMSLHAPRGTLGAQDGENQSPKYQANVHASWNVSKNVSYDTALYYVSAFSGFLVESHTRLDMNLGWRILDGLEFNLVGQDLLAPSAHEFTSPTDIHVFATDINRSVYGKFTWRY